MIDDLATRAAMTVAAFLLLATGLSVVSLSGDSAIVESARDLADHLARELDAIGRLDADVTTRIGPREESGVLMPSQIGGRPYRLEIRATHVRVVADAVLAVEALRVRVHPFPPQSDSYSAAELLDQDIAMTLTIGSGDSFLVVRTSRLVDGVLSYLTFAQADG